METIFWIGVGVGVLLLAMLGWAIWCTPGQWEVRRKGLFGLTRLESTHKLERWATKECERRNRSDPKFTYAVYRHGEAP